MLYYTSTVTYTSIYSTVWNLTTSMQRQSYLPCVHNNASIMIAFMTMLTDSKLIVRERKIAHSQAESSWAALGKLV
jgi:hypothetical protein